MRTKSLTTLLVAITCLTFPAVGRSQTSDLFSPQSVVNTTVIHKLGDIATQSNAASWYRFRLADTSGMGEYGQMISSMYGGRESLDYFTDGQQIALADTTYLIVYTVQAKPIDLTRMMAPSGLSAAALLSTDTPLIPGYLNLHAIPGIVDVRPFDLSSIISEDSEQTSSLENILGTARQSAQVAAGESNAKQIMLAVLMYSEDNDEKFPSMISGASFKKAIYKYVKSDTAFIDNATSTPFKTNPSISAKSMATFNSPATMVAIYSDPHADGRRTVGYADGHVKLLGQDAWAEAKKASNIP